MKEITEIDDISIFTVCNLAYLPKALVLADSVFKTTGNQIQIYLFDKKQDLNLEDENCKVYWIEELGVPNLLHLAFRYDIIEFSTALKPFIALNLLKQTSKVIFFDPDIYVYDKIKPILDDLNKNSILLTPHYTTPQTDDITESDTAMMRFGSFNLGFFGINKSKQSTDFLNWWSKRCIDLCYMESQFGLSTDQKWVSIAPCFFEDIKISFNLGYNAAPWNSFERNFSWDDDGKIKVNDKFTLIFFHFSNFNPDDLSYLNARSTRERGLLRNDLLKLSENYNKNLNHKILKHKELLNVNYAYNYMSNGYYISPLLRQAYSARYSELKHVIDPFNYESPVGVFAKKNFLVNKKFKAIGYMKNNLNRNESFSKEIFFANVLLKLLLILIGPNRFYIFSRGLVFFSSSRLNRTLWKK